MKGVYFIISCLLIGAGLACKEMYKPTIISSANAYLVIEGVLNAGAGPTSLRLTRTFKLDDSANIQGELNAQVLVEGKDNTTHQLSSTGSGFYTSPNLQLSINQEYRLKIVTANGKEYLSDYITAKKTPAIDSLEFKQEEKGVEVYVNTHDDLNNTRYYRWDYDETWEIRSYYNSQFKYFNDTVTPRLPSEAVSACWKYDYSKNILIGSSAKLSADIIFRQPVSFFLNGDEKLDVRYSILLRQYALDKRAHEFYEVMKKNTESLGTIFDAQPSELRGNIRCTSDPAALVIGYISASTIEEKRFFISSSQLDNWHFYQDCPGFDIPNNADSIKSAYSVGLSIYSAIYSPFGNVIARYNVSSKRCVECPERGGSLLKPSYW